jgi:HEAT repeat protein
MALFGKGKPKVKALAKRGDEHGLVAAAGYQDLVPGPDDGMVDRGAPVREEAIVALGSLGPEAGAEAVKAALTDPADAVRVSAVRVLFAREDAASLAAVLAWLPERGHSRPLAIRALLELRRPACAPELARGLVNAPGDAPVGEDEATLLGLLLEADEAGDASGDVVEELLVALADERDPVTERAEELLVLVAPASTENVIAELSAGAAPHRAAAVLAQIKDTRALEPLMDGLLHRDARVRAECAAALGELRDPAAVEALIRASRDPEHRVRAQAGWALDKLGMLALVVGVSTMIRPMIAEAVQGAEERPALTEADKNGEPDGNAPEAVSETISQEALERLLAATDEVRGPRGL